MSSFSNFIPLSEPWLEIFHINKYVKKYDGRINNRPAIRGRNNGGLSKAIERAEYIYKKRIDSRIKTLDVKV